MREAGSGRELTRSPETAAPGLASGPRSGAASDQAKEGQFGWTAGALVVLGLGAHPPMELCLSVDPRPLINFLGRVREKYK